MNFLVLAFANEKNILLSNLERSLIKYQYQYKIIGEGKKWINFMTKIQACYNYLQKVDYDIVCIIDAYDVLACDYAHVLLKKFLTLKTDIVVGAENDCGDNCVPLDEYFEKNETGRYQYANGGFYIGYRSSILKMLRYVLNLGIGDDQIGIGKYFNCHPNNIRLDTQGNLVSNVNIGSAYCDTYFVDNRVKNIKTNVYPCFIHTPSIQFDFYRRMDYFGQHLLGRKYKKYDCVTKASNFYTKYKLKVILFFIFLLILLIIFWYLISDIY